MVENIPANAPLKPRRLAKGAGKPVKLIWTREEEFSWAYVRPQGTITARSAVDANGKIVRWQFINFASGPAGLKAPYEIDEAQRTETFIEGHSPLREGSYRGLAATANHFARESHMDEIAAEDWHRSTGVSTKHLKNERLKTVLLAATDSSSGRNRKRVRAGVTAWPAALIKAVTSPVVSRWP